MKQRRIKRSHDPYQAVIRLRSGSYSIPEAGALATREQNLGNFQGAADILNLMVAQVPDFAAVHNHLGVILQAMKRYDGALASFDKAIALKPDFAEAHNNRGAVLQTLGRYEAALGNYDQAIALKADYANAHNNRGSVLRKLHRYEEALGSYDRAVAIRSDHAEAHNNRGIVLQEMKRYDEALGSFDRALALKPGYAEASNNRGLVMASKGDMTEAEKMFVSALGMRPDFPDAWFNLMNIRKHKKATNADVENINTLINRPGLPPEDQEQLLFALGKIHDDCGCYDEAFECYRRANQLRNATVGYDANGVVKMTDSIIEVFNGDFLAQTFAFASDSETPLFIVGMPRSGTTLLASILSNHRDIGTAGELPTILDFTARLPELTGGGKPYPQAATQITPAVATRLINEYEKRLRRDTRADGRLVIDKNPLNFRHLGFIAMLFPKARILHCTRHPWDTGLSNYFQRFPRYLDYSFDLRNIGHFYGEYVRLMEHWRKVLPLQMIEISYEDMIKNTEPTARRTLDFLGLEWDERCLAPHTNPCAVETASQWQVRQPIYSQSLERWRHYEKQLAPLMEMLPQGEHVPA